MADNPSAEKLHLQLQWMSVGHLYGMVLSSNLFRSFKTLIFKANFRWMVWESLSGGMNW